MKEATTIFIIGLAMLFLGIVFLITGQYGYKAIPFINDEPKAKKALALTATAFFILSLAAFLLWATG